MNIILTGGTKGIGNAMLDQLKEGNNILVISRSIRSAQKQYSKNKNLAFLSVDLSNLDQYPKVVRWVSKNWKFVDVLINNAAILQVGTFDVLDKITINKVLNVNLISPILLTKEILPYMKKNSLIVNILSPGIYRGNSNGWTYFLTKRALKEWADLLPKKLHVLNYYPGIINTGMVGEKSAMSKLFAKQPTYTAKRISNLIRDRSTGNYFEPVAILIKYIGILGL